MINLIDFNNDLLAKMNNRHTQTITAVRMNKILYFQFGFFYRQFHKKLWDYAQFAAWESGVVELIY